MLLRRYGGSYEYIMKMDCEDGMEMIDFAIYEQREERLMDRWIAMYQTRMTFNEFKENIGINSEPAEKENMSVEEILNKVKGILGG